MNQTHIHLLITHLPIFGSILGAIVLAQGIWTKTEQTKVAAYYLFILAGIGAGIAYLTGEAAAETVENIQGVLEASIEEHEEFALFALISLIALGVASIGGLYLTFIKSSLTGTAASVILVISLVSFGLVARTGYLGGQIRHTEVTHAAILPAGNSEKEADD
jgi:uncharacterized membrane protein